MQSIRRRSNESPARHAADLSRHRLAQPAPVRIFDRILTYLPTPLTTTIYSLHPGHNFRLLLGPARAEKSSSPRLGNSHNFPAECFAAIDRRTFAPARVS